MERKIEGEGVEDRKRRENGRRDTRRQREMGESQEPGGGGVGEGEMEEERQRQTDKQIKTSMYPQLTDLHEN